MPRAERPGAGMAMAQSGLSDEEELAEVAHHRELQRRLFDAGFAGICFPKEYGGQGLTPAHQQAFNEEIWPYEWPARFQVPTLQPCATLILDYGTEDQKRQHIPAILRGEEIWMQLLSEPTGGSDVAGAQTTAVRDGDEWVLNGSKIWTTGAWWADWGLCLARTNWDVPKHRGLTVFMLRLHQPSIEVHRIEMLNGSREFCQEFLTDVRVPDTDRIGDVDQGWTVGTRWMFYEKSFGMLPVVTRPTPPAGVDAGGGFRGRKRRRGVCPRGSQDRTARRRGDPRAHRRGPCPQPGFERGVSTDREGDRHGEAERSGRGSHQDHRRHARHPAVEHRAAADRTVRGRVDRGEQDRWRAGDRVPRPSGRADGGRNTGDGTERGERAASRNAPGGHGRPRGAVPRRPAWTVRPLSRTSTRAASRSCVLRGTCGGARLPARHCRSPPRSRTRRIVRHRKHLTERTQLSNESIKAAGKARCILAQRE